MNDQRKTIRPTIPTIMESPSAMEQFQNQCLRPILKLQNELLIAIVRHYLEKRKIDLAKMEETKKVQQLTHSISKDGRMRGLLFGAVVGQFTLEEWETYRTQEGECNRRITQLLTQRLVSQLEAFS
ncbi:MAG: hypothetical protein AAF798_19750 [Bacteroidota bacterium]